jgi:tetratricopeptide (TPR) repeat protein
MAAQKRLNKNLVAFLTVMGMIVVISVLALIVRQQSRRDPELLAQSARDSRRSGDLDEAMRRFLRAWEASDQRGQPNTKYVIEAADCLYEMGELNKWYSLLEHVSAKMPNDQTLLVATLEGLWRALEITGGIVGPDLWRDAGEKLAKLEENNLLALTSTARGLWELKGAENEARADRLAEQAFQQAPRDPRVAMTYLMYLRRKAQAELAAAVEAGSRSSDADRVNRKFVSDVLSVMGPALDDHPRDVLLVTTYVDFLQSEARRLDQEGDAARATELLARAGDALQHALEARPEQPSAEVYFALADLERAQFERAHKNVTPAEAAKFREEIERIDKDAQRAIELDAAMFEADTLRADLIVRFAVGPQGEELPLAQRLEQALELFEAAQKQTLTLRNMRALLRPIDRLLMLRGAFDVAMGYDIQRAAGEQGGPPPLARAEAFLEDARTRYPEHSVTFYMQGQLQIAKGDAVAAIATLQQAHAKAEQERLVQAYGQARYWFGNVRANRLPSEQLALLYAQRAQYGEAQRWAELAVREFRDAGAVPPALLVATDAEMLRQIGKPEDALSVLDEYRPRYPDDESLKAVRVSVLTDLKRGDDAKRELAQIGGTGASTDLWRAQKATEQGDYALAERTLRAVMKDESASDEQFREALQRLVDVLDREHRRPDARALVQQLKSDPPRGGLQRILERLELELAVEDPTKLTAEQRKELDDKRLALIAQAPNALARAQEYYQFYATRGEWEQALPHLEEMRKQMPAELRLVEEEFRVRLGLRQFERVGELLAQLSQYDGGVGFDHAGGATYRGDLALTKGDAPQAVSEYRQAEQKLQAKSGELEIKLARAYLIAGRINEGLDTLKRAVEINPRSFDAQYLLRQVYRQKAAQTFGTEKADNEKAAADAQAKASELSPDHPDVQAWKAEAAEERDPLKAIAEREQNRAANPDDPNNLMRLGDLLIRAWRQAAGGPDESMQQQVLAVADRFFSDVIFTATGDTQSRLARSAAEFYSLAQRAEEGAGLLRRLIEQRSGEGRVEAQLLLAMFFEALGNPDAAEREYQQAQRLSREATQDATVRRRLELNVGMGLIRFHQRQRRLDKVVEACRWLLDRLGSDAAQAATAQPVRLALVEALYSAGQLSDAEAEIGDYLKVYPDDLAGLNARAQLYLRKRERDLALKDLNSVLERNPEDVLALYSRGRLALERGRYDKAREDLVKAEELIAREPRLEPDLRRQLASLYARTRQYDLAATELRNLLEALENQGGLADQKQRVVRQLAHLLYMALGQFDKAQRLISEYMEKHPTDPMWPFELGRLFETQADNAQQEANAAKKRGDATKERERLEAVRQGYSSAVTYYQRSAERAGEKNAQERIAALIARVGALNRAGRGTEVLDAFQKTDFALMPDQFRAEAKARMGMEAAKAQQAAGAADAARTQWQQALHEACTQNVALAGDVAIELRKALSDRPGEVESLLRQMVADASPNDAVGQRLRIVLATHLCVMGNAAGSLPLLSEALAKVGKGTAEHLSALLTRAQAQDLAGDKEGSVRTYKEILADYEDNQTALNNLAYTLVDAPPPVYAPAEARRYAERLQGLLLLGENTGTMLDTIGWVHFHVNELDLAVSALEEALSVGGPSPAICLHLAQVYQKLNRIADARSVLSQGLELARQSSSAEDVRQLEEALAKLK